LSPRGARKRLSPSLDRVAAYRIDVPHATNALDGRRIYFEDDGGAGTPIVLYGGIFDSVELVRRSQLARALQELSGEFRLIYADHRGLGRSDKPHEMEAYAMRLQAADTVAVLDEVAIERVLSLVAGGQQPYAIDPDAPLARLIRGVLDATRRVGVSTFVEALEDYWDTRFPEPERRGYLAQDGAAVVAAAEAMLAQPAVSDDLRAWRVPCLIYLGAGDIDFLEQARRAASEIPHAEFLALDELDHYAAHFEADRVVPAVLRTLREHSPPGQGSAAARGYT
jgi:pimeloyl-ACP methyl ester carboxylesterase